MHTLNPHSGKFPLPGEAIAIANHVGIASSRVKQKRGRKIKKEKGIRNTWSFSRLQEAFPFNEYRLWLLIPVRFWFSGCVFR
jgi:hypothetical protein